MPNQRRLAATITVPSDALAPSEARRSVRNHLEEWGYAGLADDAMLITSEVVTNAVRYGAASTVHVELTADDRGVRIAVSDANGSALPQLLQPPADAPGGRGMSIVAAVAASWGVQPGAAGKVVWAELPPTV